MKTAKNIALIGVFTALLIGSQLVFSYLAGVEIVTVLFLSFVFVFGTKKSMILATAFSLLRCFVFGPFPTIILLYLIYYNLVAIAVGKIGDKIRDKNGKKIRLLMTIVGVISTLVFYLLDVAINFLLFGANYAIFYALQGGATFLIQTTCVIVSIALLFPKLTDILKRVKIETP